MSPVTNEEIDREALEALDRRLRAILPEDYQDSYDEVSSAPMKSAGLKFDANGRVLWGDIWGSYCDLAMAGGPPHKGTLLEPGTSTAVDADPERYAQVAEEICRGVRMSTDLDAEPSPNPGWIRLLCGSGVMAAWLLRAITMENVAVRASGATVDLPASPAFRLEKEIKNVVTVIAKTTHYWLGHMSKAQHGGIARIFAEVARESPLIEPAAAGTEGISAAADRLAKKIEDQTALTPAKLRYPGWLGLECPDVKSAVWIMRSLVVSNVLARREGTALFVPVNPAADPDGTIVSRLVARVHRLARAKGIL
jgi:sirohydrochlorin cobaltochelatase